MNQRAALEMNANVDESRVLIALDFDCFYASVALLTRPHLHDKPVAIRQKHLCVTANYVARRLGVKKMASVGEAIRICPTLEIIDGSDLTPFRDANKQIVRTIVDFFNDSNKQYKENAYKMEKLGLDELFIDVSDIVKNMSVNMPWKFEGCVFNNHTLQNDQLYRWLMIGSHIACQLRTYIYNQTGLTCCAGISISKLLSKLCANLNKPNKQTTLLIHNYSEFVSNYSMHKLPWLGSNILQVFHDYNKTYATVGHISSDFPIHTNSLFLSSIQKLKCMFLQRQHLYQSKVTHSFISRILLLLHGVDNTPVVHSVHYDTCSIPSKSISVEDACKNCADFHTLQNIVNRLASRFIQLLIDDYENEHRKPQSMSVGFRRRGDGHKSTWKSRKAPTEVLGTRLERNNAHSIVKVKKAITTRMLLVLKEDANVSSSSSFQLTLVGVGVSNFTKSNSNAMTMENQSHSLAKQQNYAVKTNDTGKIINHGKGKSMDISSFFSKRSLPATSTIINNNGKRQNDRVNDEEINGRAEKKSK